MYKLISNRLPSLLVVVVTLPVVFPGTAVGLTPESPEVKQAIAKAVSFLGSAGGKEGRTGGKALVGLALLKAGSAPDHPRIVEAVQAIRNDFQNINNSTDEKIVYSSGLAIIFLVTLDPEKYKSEIDSLLRYLQSIQKPNGGWGYPAGHRLAQTSDTSMTQYAALSAWEATQVGFVKRLGVAQAAEASIVDVCPRLVN